MEVVLEQFIPSDRPKKISNMLTNAAIGFGILALLFIFLFFIIGIALAIVAATFFIGSYFMYVDYEYELFNGDINVTKVYNASRRKIAEKINKDEVKRVYLAQGRGSSKSGVITYYNTNIQDLNIYAFQLNSNKIIELALNEEMERIVKIIYVKKMGY